MSDESPPRFLAQAPPILTSRGLNLRAGAVLVPAREAESRSGTEPAEPAISVTRIGSSASCAPREAGVVVREVVRSAAASVDQEEMGTLRPEPDHSLAEPMIRTTSLVIVNCNRVSPHQDGSDKNKGKRREISPRPHDQAPHLRAES